MKRILGKPPGFKGARASASAPRCKPQADRLLLLLEFFPIRKKLRFYPVHEMNLVFDTIVLAYCVNGHFIYSAEAMIRNTQGQAVAFQAGEHEIPLAEVRLFQLLVPDAPELVMKLEDRQRMPHGQGRKSGREHCIGLKSSAGCKGAVMVESVVSRQIVPQEGPFAHTNMILLTPELRTIRLTDQRKSTRTKIQAPATVSRPDEKFYVSCTFVDISGGVVRLRVRDSGVTMPAMLRGDEVILEVDLGAEKRHCAIRGEVIRRSADACVTHLDGLLEDGRLNRFSPRDLVELQAGLLAHG